MLSRSSPAYSEHRDSLGLGFPETSVLREFDQAVWRANLIEIAHF